MAVALLFLVLIFDVVPGQVVPAEFLAEKAALAAEKELAEKIELSAKQAQVCDSFVSICFLNFGC
jgi:cell division protein FtsI/penicillin-binding protein 2